MAARTTLFVSSLLVSLLGVSAPAMAAPPTLGGPSGGAGPEQEACEGRASGDACVMPNEQGGICGPATCNRLDYSGGSPPKAIEEPCLVCKAGGSPMLGAEGGEAADPPATKAGTDPKPEPDAKKDPPASKSQCEVDSRGSSPAGLALLAGLALGFRRRRRP